MKRTLAAFIMIFVFGMSISYSQVAIGEKAPDFKLKNVDGKMVSLSDYKNEKGVILIFNCNHCPYAKLYEQRIIELHRHYKHQKFPVISINPNDSAVYQEDGFSFMVAKDYEFPYLLDNVGVYKKYGATKTPHVYLLKNEGNHFKVAYIGAIDDNPQNPNEVKEKYLEMAIASLKNKQKPDPSVTKAIGCSIKPFR